MSNKYGNDSREADLPLQPTARHMRCSVSGVCRNGSRRLGVMSFYLFGLSLFQLGNTRSFIDFIDDIMLF